MRIPRVGAFAKRISCDADQSAFALVSTLIILVVVTILAVGFLTTSSLERSSSHAYTYIYDAQLAAGMGLEAAKKALSVDGQGNYTTMNDSYIVMETGSYTSSGTLPTDSNGNVLRYYFIGSGSNAAAGTINYYPLFAQSGSPSAPYFQNVSGTSQPSCALANTVSGTVDPTLFSTLQPQVSLAWISTGTASAGSPALRYTYWVEDMGGYIDADVAGNMSGTNQTHTRDLSIMQPLINSGSAMPASMIALWSLLDGTAPLDVQGTPEDQTNTNLVTDRQAILTPGTVLQTIIGGGTGTTTTIGQNVVAGLRPDVEQEIIPYGFGYANQGQPKTDLDGILTNISNSTITSDAGVTQIASAITNNLPNFASGRRGGLANSQDYNKTIAANIIGYATKSTTPVVDPNNPAAPTYRGLGAYPLVNEVADSSTLMTIFTNGKYPPPPLTGTNTTSLVELQVSTYIELWNMTNQTITGTAKLVYVYNNPIAVGANSYLNIPTMPSANLSNGSTATVTPADPSNSTQFAPQVITMLPNQFLVINTGAAPDHLSSPPYLPSGSFPPTFTTTYVLNSNAAHLATSFNMQGSLTTASYSFYQFYWNNVLVDQSWQDIKSKGIGTGTTNWQDACAALRCTETPGEATGAYYENPGDSRASFYFYLGSTSSGTSAMEQVNYAAGSSFGARNWRSDQISSPEPIYAEARPSDWADSGHNSSPPNIPLSGSWASNQTPISQAALAPANQPTMAPVFISSSGSLGSITELGNIYDPAQWNVGVASTGTMPASWSQSGWKDISGTATADSRYGGGFNLRIGKQEFTKFNTTGLRASQLMDIFCVGSTRQTQGLVNLNTATFNTLRALGAGLLFCSGTGSWNKDAAIQLSGTGGLYPPTTTQQADKFANAVIAARATTPFLSTAQLSQLVDTSGTYFFGNMGEWTSPQAVPSVWNDAASKEYFSRIYDLTSVRSRNFRVYVIGQAVDKNGNVLSTAKKVYQVFLHPQRDGSGNITSQYVQTTYEKDL